MGILIEMKLWIGLVAILGLASALDYSDYDERAKCKCSKTPSDCSNDCAHCEDHGSGFVKGCGKKYAKACKKLGFKKGKCKGDGSNGGGNCSSNFPIKCSECESMGKKCIKENNAEAQCKDLGYKGKKGCKGVDEEECPAPTQCFDCMNHVMSSKCLKKHKKPCKELGYSKKLGCP